MNRQIKFRGKRITNDEWVYGSLAQWSNGAAAILVSEDGYRAVWKLRIDPDTVGRYTGLKDDDEKEIYEGDIIEDKYKNRYEVRYDNKRMSWIAHSTIPFENNIPLCIVTECTIIGNIHDNPELLEGRK